MTNGRIPQGTPEWFEMVGKVMSDAAERAGLSPDHNVSLVERYSDGVNFGDGLIQGFRFDIVDGKPSYRVGVQPDERGDINVTVASAVARKLNQLGSAEAATAREDFTRSGKIREEGDMTRLGDWFPATHAKILDRTT